MGGEMAICKFINLHYPHVRYIYGKKQGQGWEAKFRWMWINHMEQCELAIKSPSIHSTGKISMGI